MGAVPLAGLRGGGTMGGLMGWVEVLLLVPKGTVLA